MSTPKSNPVLRFGCYHWDHPQWRSCYFPEDLPEDWRLAYYANEADCVLLSSAAVRALSEAELDALALDELDAGFRLFISAGEGAGEADSALRRLGARLDDLDVGVLYDGASPDAGLGISAYQPRPVPSGMAWASTDDGARRGLLRIDDLNLELRAWRKRLDELRPWLNEFDELAFIIEGDRVHPGELAQLRTLAQLMDIA